MAAIVQTQTYQPLFLTMDPTEQNFGTLEYTPNPHFCFPAAESTSDASIGFSTPRRTTSLHSSQSPSSSRRRGPHHKSVSTLPTFTFNSADTSGRLDDARTDESAGQVLPNTPRATGHRRGASEFVGGDGRRGIADFLGPSPTKPTPDAHLVVDTVASGSPVRKRGHAHRRSTAISGHDLPSILQSRDDATSTLEKTALPAPLPTFDFASAMQASASSAEDVPETSPSVSDMVEQSVENRPKVGFCDNVEFIPRPLSPISSGSESSSNTPVAHSVRDSISSILDLGNASPSPLSRRTHSLLAFEPQEHDTPSRVRSSLELSSDHEKEGHWLRKDDDMPTIDRDLQSQNPCIVQLAKPKHLSARPNIDRRRSEPSLGVVESDTELNKSTISLQEPVPTRFPEHLEKPSFALTSRRSSLHKVRKWASGMMNFKEKTLSRPKSADFALRSAARSTLSPDLVPSVTVSPSEEPDLEELFSSHDPFSQPESQNDQMPLPRLDFGSANDFQPVFDQSGDAGSIDLDAALGPHSPRTARLHAFSTRRQLHSSRGGGSSGSSTGSSRDFGGYQGQFHRRTESAPILTRFDYGMSGSPVQSPMADVFEEDEGEEEEHEAVTEAPQQPVRVSGDSDLDEGTSLGIQIMDEVPNVQAPSPTRSVDEGLGIQESLGSLNTPYNMSSSSHHNMLIPDRRPSLIEDTIFEEPSIVEIVGDDEEPRASTITKSSTSSDATTILADHSGAILMIPPPGPGQASLMTPTTYAASTFSTPDFTRRQGSFDTSRLGTSASSMTDCRTMSSFAPDQVPGTRTSVDDVPSLTSSRSTMISSTNHGTSSRRDISDRSTSSSSTQASLEQNERRRKRSSIQSLSKLVGASFGESRSKPQADAGSQPSTSTTQDRDGTRRKKEHRLSRLMFWKNRQSSSTSSSSK